MSGKSYCSWLNVRLSASCRTNFPSLVLVTDAIVAMGLSDGTYTLGEQVNDKALKFNLVYSACKPVGLL